jgi:ribosomal-protein-alanine N-acetyltransferase
MLDPAKPTGTIGSAMPSAPLTTARLRYRRPTAADVDAIFARYATDPEVTRFLAWPRHRTRTDTEAFVAFSTELWAACGLGPLLIESIATGELLGSTGLAPEGPGKASTGYLLARDAWGRGYATEALAAMVALAQRQGVGTLETFCHPDHRASRHVLEKAGFEQAGSMERLGLFPNLPDTDPGFAIRYSRPLSHE